MQEHVSLEPANTPFLPLSLFSGVAAVKNLAICKTPTLWIKHNIMHINIHRFLSRNPLSIHSR